MTSAKHPILWWIYPICLSLLILAWVGYMMVERHWVVWSDRWPAAVTMMFGSFVAGSTPAGGGAVAFPVFTKLLEVETMTARTFSLMIQSVGMTMATLFILSRRIPISARTIRVALPGGILGLMISFFGWTPPDPWPRLVFTIVMVVFAISMAISHWGLRWAPCPKTPDREFAPRHLFHLFLVGLVGGYVSGLIGSGIDLVVFMALTLGYGLHEKHAVPTTVILMAGISVVGTGTLLVIGDSTVAAAWPWWLVSAPVVAVGAPMGAWVASRVGRDFIVVFVLILISLELITTTLILGWTGNSLGVAAVVAIATGAYFWWMLRNRTAFTLSQQKSSLADAG